MSDFETYVNDQFVLRDGWIALKSATELALGKQENNGVYFGKQDTLITHFQAPDAGKVTNNLSYVNKFVENVDIPVYFSLIPTQACIWADRLPEGAPNASQTDLLTQAQAATQANWYDTYPSLWAHRDEDIFYRTDHHWTSLGAYYGPGGRHGPGAGAPFGVRQDDGEHRLLRHGVFLLRRALGAPGRDRHLCARRRDLRHLLHLR